ncbi:MAG TPA: hypothetical protein VHG35_15375 [Gemmatimonadales bacterium]|nr:hypothetical protein [Gemmatimonadales bacterium]
MKTFKLARMRIGALCFCFAFVGCSDSPGPESQGAREAVEAELQDVFSIWVPLGSITIDAKIANGYGNDYDRKYPAEYEEFIGLLEAQGFVDVERPEQSLRRGRGLGSRVFELEATEKLLSLQEEKPLKDDYIALQIADSSGVTVVEALPSSEVTPGERSWWVTGTFDAAPTEAAVLLGRGRRPEGQAKFRTVLTYDIIDKVWTVNEFEVGYGESWCRPEGGRMHYMGGVGLICS